MPFTFRSRPAGRPGTAAGSSYLTPEFRLLRNRVRELTVRAEYAEHQLSIGMAGWERASQLRSLCIGLVCGAFSATAIWGSLWLMLSRS